MNRFTKMLLIVAIALGCLAMFSADSAEAGWFHGGGCYRPSYSTSYRYVSSGYRPSYSCYSSYAVPAVYRSTCYSSPSFYGGSYCGSYGGYGGYSPYAGGYGNFCGGYGGYQPLTNYGCYSGMANGYAVPVSYGYCGW